MKIFLTGATGFIGTAILAEVTTEGHEVYALARDLSRFYPVIEQLPSSLQQRIKPIVGDLSLPRLGMSSADYELLTDVDFLFPKVKAHEFVMCFLACQAVVWTVELLLVL